YHNGDIREVRSAGDRNAESMHIDAQAMAFASRLNSRSHQNYGRQAMASTLQEFFCPPDPKMGYLGAQRGLDTYETDYSSPAGRINDECKGLLEACEGANNMRADVLPNASA